MGDVHDRLMHLGAKLTVKTIDDIIAGTLTPIPQDQLIGDTEPTPAPKIFKEDCEIDWTLPAEKIHNHVRGLSPYPAAWSTLISDNQEQGAMKIFETRLLPDAPAMAPGEIAIEGDTLTVGTATCPIQVLSLQAPGKRRVSTPDYLRGARLVTPRFGVGFERATF